MIACRGGMINPPNLLAAPGGVLLCGVWGGGCRTMASCYNI